MVADIMDNDVVKKKYEIANKYSSCILLLKYLQLKKTYGHLIISCALISQ